MATFIYEKISLSLLVPLLIIYCLLLLYQNGPLGVEMPSQNSLAWFGPCHFFYFPVPCLSPISYNKTSICL
jgi:hypothetical protein